MSSRAALAAVKKEKAEVQRQLQHLQKQFWVEVEGQVRLVQIELDRARELLQAEMMMHSDTKINRAVILKQLRNLESERAELVAEVAAHTATIATLRGSLGAAARKERAVELASQKAERVRVGLVAAAHRRADAAESKAATASKQRLEDAERRVREAEGRVLRLEQLAHDAQQDAQAARAEALVETRAAAESAAEADGAKYQKLLAEQREARAKRKIEKLEQRQIETVPLPGERSVDEWAALNNAARWKAAQLEREAIISFFKSRAWRFNDVADALVHLQWVGPLMKTTPFALVAFEREKQLVGEIETDHFGISFGLMLHYDAHLTIPKILAITQARVARLPPPPSPPLAPPWSRPPLRGGADHIRGDLAVSLPPPPSHPRPEHLS